VSEGVLDLRRDGRPPPERDAAEIRSVLDVMAEGFNARDVPPSNGSHSGWSGVVANGDRVEVADAVPFGMQADAARVYEARATGRNEPGRTPGNSRRRTLSTTPGPEERFTDDEGPGR
jgi:hypothetical protein